MTGREMLVVLMGAEESMAALFETMRRELRTSSICEIMPGISPAGL